METPRINTTNPEAISYQTEEVGYTVLGGIRLDGLDRLRVTLKIEVTDRKFKHYLNNPDIADLALRQNLDLYNDTQVEKLIRKTAERLEVGSSQIAKAVADITNQLENYRLQQIEAHREQNTHQKKQLTEQEQREAKLFLQAQNLLNRTNDYIGKSGVTGEEHNRLLMYLIFTSRKQSHPLHIVSLGSSGTGKTHLQEKVSELIPEEDKIEITTLSENAFYYFGQRELQHKLILIEDLDGAENVLYPLRELQSKKRISKTVTFKDTTGKTKTVTLVVEGPVSVAGCTTKERIYEDNANRSFLIYLDESTEQDNKIMEYQRQISAGQINTEQQEQIKKLLQNTQRVLQPLKVKNPYAPYLQLPPEVFKPRRTNKHYLDFIEVITYYHQYQRRWINEDTGEIIYDPNASQHNTKSLSLGEGKGEVYIETTIEDIQAANTLMKEILLRKSDELSGACRNYLEKIKQYLKQENKSTFSNKEVRQAYRTNHNLQKMYMVQLQQYGYVQKAEGNKKQGYLYEVESQEEYTTLQDKVSKVLDEIVSNIEKREVKKLEEVVEEKQPHKPQKEKKIAKKL